MSSSRIRIKSTHTISLLRESGKYLTELLFNLYQKAQPGVSLLELEEYAISYLTTHKLKGAFKGYHGFPANLCTSVNDCVVHGIPDDYILQNGDLLKIDCGVIYQKAISDSAFSKVIGGEEYDIQAAQLVHTTKDALDQGLQHIIPGNTIHAYAASIENFVQQAGYSILRQLSGHGVGHSLHEPPYIYNYPHPQTKKTHWKPGMVVALEPITAVRSTDFYEDKENGWNLYTTHGDPGAQWEYMIVITEQGYEILSGLTEIPT